jgi:hypothetical protein
MKKISLMLLAVTALTACSKFEPVSKGGDENVPVELSGNIYTGATTRGDGIIVGLPESGEFYNLNVYRADQIADDDWTGVSKYVSRVNAQLAHDGAITSTPALYYAPNANRKSSFIGLYPQGGTFDPDANTVKYTAIDGGTDILGSQFVEGNKSTSTPLNLAFSHLLTRIDVELIINEDDEDLRGSISNAWGPITGISVGDKKVDALVTLPAPGAAGFPVVTTDAGSTPDDLPLVDEDGVTAPSILLPTGTNSVPFGHAIFVPFSGPLTLKAYTDSFGEVTATASSVTLEVGKSYTVVLGFTITSGGGGALQIVSFTATTINSWTPGAGDPIEAPVL